MTNDFDELLREPVPPPPDEGPFHAKLRELAEAIRQRFPALSAQAVLQASTDLTEPNQLVLRVSPVQAAQRSWDALQFRIDRPDQISVLGGAPIGGPAEYYQYLRRQLSDGPLRRSLATLNDEAERPIEGVLRTLDPNTLGANDVVVRMRAGDYEALRRADGEHRLSMRQATPVVVAPFVPALSDRYRFLTVEGGTWRLVARPTQDVTGEIEAKLEVYDDGRDGFGPA